MTKREFRPLPGSHSETLRNHLYTILFSKRGKTTPGGMKKKLRIEAVRMLTRLSNLSKETERKMAGVEIQTIRMEKAQRQLKKNQKIHTTLARRLLIRAIKQLEELSELRERKGVSKSLIMEQLSPAFKHLDQLKRNMDMEEKYVRNVNSTLELIANVNIAYFREITGTAGESKFDKMPVIRRFAFKASRRMTKK